MSAVQRSVREVRWRKRQLLVNHSSFWLMCIFGVLRYSTVQGEGSKAINSFAGPYIAYADRIYMCDPDRQHKMAWALRTSHFNPRKPAELQLISGNLTLTLPLTDSLAGNATVDRWANNQWKENAFQGVFPNGACRHTRRNIPGFFELFFRPGNTDVCRVEAGVYQVERRPVNWTFPNFPIFPYGFYRFKIRFIKGNDLLFCGAVDCHAIPKLK
ncbi:Spermidine/putrescine import ATP-binding protein PotA [Frankliniella fusca]|uniref:Spermidine/putrescine import ATP-binding protein PotA n=1 Tax=Frankliniella fusca TaxID=407009 RepID=A0AAE1LJP0_9NEOP|nr:Spermidine/putrescine import ATP-binding protein PotA [Frankliniella fusca]